MNIATGYNKKKNKPRVQICGHRGARGLSPENTLPAYRTALAIGIDFVDIDINMTKDGILVATHDLALNPALTRRINQNSFISENNLWIKKLTFEELKGFDVGRLNPRSKYGAKFPDQLPVDNTRIPRLKDVIRFVNKIGGNKIRFQIEMKTDPTIPEGSSDPKKMALSLTKILEQEDIIDRTEVQAFDFKCLLHLDPKIQKQFLTHAYSRLQMMNPIPKKAGLWTPGFLLKDYHGSIPEMISAMGIKSWGVQDISLTRKLAEEAHAKNLKIVVWSGTRTLKSGFDSLLTRKMIDYGAAVIVADRPDMLRGLMAARGLDLPPCCTEEKPCV